MLCMMLILKCTNLTILEKVSIGDQFFLTFFFGLFGAPTFCSAAISAACIPSYHLNMLDNMDPCILFNVSHTSQIMIRHWILAKRQMLMVFLPDKHPEWRAVNKHTDDILKYIPGLEEATVVVNMFMLFLTSG